MLKKILWMRNVDGFRRISRCVLRKISDLYRGAVLLMFNATIYWIFNSTCSFKPSVYNKKVILSIIVDHQVCSWFLGRI